MLANVLKLIVMKNLSKKRRFLVASKRTFAHRSGLYAKRNQANLNSYLRIAAFVNDGGRRSMLLWSLPYFAFLNIMYFRLLHSS